MPNEITDADAWEAWRSLSNQIEEMRKALQALDQVASTLLAYLPSETSGDTGDE